MCDWISLSINWIEVYYYLSSWCSAVGSFRYLISTRRAMKRGMRRRRRRHFLFFMSFLILNNSLIASSREQSRDWRFIKLVFCAFLYSSFLSSLFFFLVEEWRICAYLGVAMEKIISTANNGDDFFWFDNRRAQLWNALSFWQLELNYQSQRKLRTKTREIEDDLSFLKSLANVSVGRRGGRWWLRADGKAQDVAHSSLRSLSLPSIMSAPRKGAISSPTQLDS